MKGSESKIVKYMAGSDKRFVIPVYQRNYDWKIENCKQLYDDLIKIVRNHRKSHFFGGIVSAYDPDGIDEEYLIIDGQQRLTTVSLLLLAMYNLMDKGICAAEDTTLKRKIYEEYLVDKYKPEDKRIKLKQVKNDRTAYSKLFKDSDNYVRESNLTVNYDYFYERIQKQEITIDELYNAICKLEIINIKLDSDDNPQMVFESLNSTGLDLSEGDKIRNFILMGLPTKQQEDYYEKYWNPIEVCTKYDVSSFIRDYLSIKQQAIPQQKKIYINFKDYVDMNQVETESLLKDMLSYAKRYLILLGERTGRNDLDACIYRLNRLETTVTRPFFLEVLRLYDEKKLTIEEVTQVFLITENYLFRRTICDLPTNALNKIFLMLHKEIIRYDNTEENYVEKLKYALISKKERSRFPNDEEFAEMFSTKQIYLMNSKSKIYLFERLENAGTLEDKDVYRHCDEGTYSIEHIMPQHLTPSWQKELGEDYEQIHDEWLHRVGNLTLTAYNSRYSNNSFQEKKTMKNGFEDSGIRMNTWIAKKDHWTLNEIQERSQYLSDRALSIWNYPITEFKPAEKQMEAYTLQDDEELTGRLIAKFTFKNTEQPVDSWVDMFQKMIQILYAEDSTIITKLAYSSEDGLAIYFSTNKDGLTRYVDIADGIYVWTNTSTHTKLGMLNKLFQLYDEDPSDLVFYLRNDSEEAQKDDDWLHELRKKFWSYALPIINRAYEDEQSPFGNISSSKYVGVNGHIGISGFHIRCVARFDSARVEFWLDKRDDNLNKKAFDLLSVHKDEIEKTVNASLIWDRREDAKAASISYHLNGVDINNESDWLRMANFIAEWSKKFYDVLVPYLRGM